MQSNNSGNSSNNNNNNSAIVPAVETHLAELATSDVGMARIVQLVKGLELGRHALDLTKKFAEEGKATLGNLKRALTCAHCANPIDAVDAAVHEDKN